MAALGEVVTITTSPTLIFEFIDGFTYKEKGYTRADNPQIFLTGTPNDPVPVLLLFPTDATIFLGGSTVAASGDDVGASISGVPSLTYNVVGGDSLYGIVGSSTQDIQILVLRQ